MRKQQKKTYHLWKKALAFLLCFLLVVSFDLSVTTGIAAGLPESSGLQNNAVNDAENKNPDGEAGAGKGTEQETSKPGEPETESEPSSSPEPETENSKVPVDGEASAESSLPEEESSESSDEDLEDPENRVLMPEGLIEKNLLQNLKGVNQRMAYLGEPAHNKYIEPAGDGNHYLTLDVKGDSVETISAPVEIVIAFDVSASTSNLMIECFKAAARKMMDILLTAENAARDPSMQHRIAIVDFNDVPRTLCSFSSDISVVGAAIDQIASRPIFTSWSNAINYSYNLMASDGRANSRKHLLFLADGHPNAPSSNGEYKLYPYNKAYTAAYDVLRRDVTFYSIAAIDGSNDFYNDTTFMYYVDKTKAHPLSSASDLSTAYGDNKWLSLEAITRNAYANAGRADEADGKFFTVENENQTQYETALEAIGKEISKVHVYTDITITDSLTDYVELLNTTDGTGQILDAKVVKTDKDGIESPIANYTLHYDTADRKVVFTIDEELQHDVTYSVTLTVKASAASSAEWADNQAQGLYADRGNYPHTGDAGTGSSSAGKNGFYTNSEATLKYYVQSTNGEVVLGEEQTATPYGKPVIQLSTYPEIDEDEPMHRKFIEPNGDGTYQLRLNVLGDTKQLIAPADPADIVIVFDVSASTTPNMVKCFKEAAREMSRLFLTDANSAKEPEKQNRISIVTFKDSATALCGFTSNPTELETYIKAITSGPGRTNWQSALQCAENLFTSQGRANSRKFVLFQTDGQANEPESTEVRSYNAAYNQALSMVQNGITLYSIAALDEVSTFMWFVGKSIVHPLPNSYAFETYATSDNWRSLEALTRRAYMNNSRPGEAENKFFSVEHESEKDYLDAFDAIAADISKSRTFSDIVITDTLSEYAVLENAVDASGNIQGAAIKKYDLNFVEYDVDDYTLTYDAPTKTVTFTVNGLLEHGMVYYVEFTVSPSQLAFDELAQNRYAGQNTGQDGYPHTGGPGTGSASEAQAGFYSNTEATLTYHTIITSEGGSVSEQRTATPYEKPVLQLELSTIDIVKLWDNDDESERPPDIEIILSRDGTPFRRATLTAADDWTVSFNDLPGGVERQVYTIEEIEVEGYEVSYSERRVEFSGLLAQTASLTVTNFKNDGDLAIYKTDSSYRLGLEGAEFRLYKADDSWSIIEEMTGYQILTLSDGYSFLYDLPFGKYILKETKAPQGYVLLEDPIRIDFTRGSDTVIVVNQMQYTLPATGGGGTYPYMIVGALFISLSLYLVLHKRRKISTKGKDV